MTAEQAQKAHPPQKGPVSVPPEALAKPAPVEVSSPAPPSVPTVKRSSLADLRTAARARAAQAV